MEKELTRRSLKKARIRQRLYEAAIELFKEQGYESTTVQQIADAADTGKATFFNYFPTKEHILADYQDQMTGEILNALSRRRPSSAEQAIQNAMEECANWVRNDLVMGRIIIRTMFASEVMIDRDSDNERRFLEWFHLQVEAGIKSGELRSDLDIDILLSLVMAALSSTVLEWVSAGQKFDLRKSLKRKIEFLFDSAKAR